MDYIYHGDKLTDPQFKKQPCKAVRKENGKSWVSDSSKNIGFVKFKSGKHVLNLSKLFAINESKKLTVNVKLFDQRDFRDFESIRAK